MVTKFQFPIIVLTTLTLAAAGCRSEDGDRHAPAVTGGVAIVTSQDPTTGLVGVDITPKQGVVDVDLKIMGRLRGSPAGVFTSTVATFNNINPAILPVTLEYVQQQLDQYEEIQITGRYNNTSDLAPATLSLARLNGTQVTFNFPPNPGGTGWGFSMTRTATSLLPAGADVRVDVLIEDAIGVRLQAYNNRNLGGGPSNGITHGDPGLIRDSDTLVRVTISGPDFVGPSEITFQVPTDMGGSVTRNVTLSPN